MDEKLIPQHGGYRNLKTFQLSQLVFDITVRFCDRFVCRFSRTRDQMVQAARSGVQNIAEGSLASATSKKTELRLTSVARASLEELLLDYLDFLRQNRLAIWDRQDPRRDHLIKQRCQTADQVAYWVKAMHAAGRGSVEELSANGVIALLTVCTYLLDRQIKSLAEAFENEGGFSERMYRIRSRKRSQSRA